MPADDSHYDALKASGWVRTDDVGFAAFIGPFWARGVGHHCFLVEDRHLNRRGHVHGGMLLAFADRYLHSAAKAGNTALPTATVQIDMHFVAPGHLGDVVELKSRAVRHTRSLLFVDGDLTINGTIIATAKGVWKILGQG
jgi:acyl-coenzyme A thioesterase PaaI-like protein